MSSAVHAAVCALARGLEANFKTRGVSASVAVGWTARSRSDNQGPGGANRVTLIPGEYDTSGGALKTLRAGRIDREGSENFELLDPRYRVVAWAHEVVTVCVWAVDLERPNDDAAQIEAASLLREQTISGLHNANDPRTKTPVGFGNIEEWGDAYWTLPPAERAYGREYVFALTLLVPILDPPVSVAFPSVAVARNPAA